MKFKIFNTKNKTKDESHQKQQDRFMHRML
jgi:hypothetical protein